MEEGYPKCEKIILVNDNLNTHTPASLYKVFPPAEARRILDKIEFHYTPKHSSWLNQIEIWLSILVRKLLKRGSFTSVADLQAKVLAFIDYYNRTMAKPFKWTYQGKPLCA